ncbi:MAG: protein kinase [Planctomycetes bacterium]|nr:protein kinase [Planctomycetota bacterium]
MAIQFLCSNYDCRVKLTVGEDLVGKKVKCPKCQTIMLVPDSSTDSDTRGDGALAATLATPPNRPQEAASGLPRDQAEQTFAGHPRALDVLLESKGIGLVAFEVERDLARGGMGAVRICRDQILGRAVAMKVMHPQIARSEEYRLRFLEEAQVTGQLEHPNIVPIHELGKDAQGNLYFTMKLVKGKSLGQMLRELKEGRQGASFVDLLNVFLKVCDGMAFAHSKGVIHRDLKPDNIMVGDFGEVLVMDWGLAKILGNEPREAPDGPRVTSESVSASGPEKPLSDSEFRKAETVRSVRKDSEAQLTMEGALTGTPTYMSPEQAAGQINRLDHRTDIYSLGAILYEILTLERPVEGKDVVDLLRKVRAGYIIAPVKRAPARRIPPELSAVVMKAMEKNLRKRYPSVTDLAGDIKRFLEGRSVSAKDDTLVESLAKLVRRNRALSVFVGAAFALLTLLTVLFIVRLQAEGERARRSEESAIRARDSQRVAAIEGSEKFAQWAVQAASERRWEQAGFWGKEAEKVASNGPWGPYALGRIEQMRNNHEVAVECFRTALSRDPNHEASRGPLKESQAFMRDLESARQVVKGKPSQEKWETLVALGQKFYEAERWQESLGSLERGVEMMQNTLSVPPPERDRIKADLDAYFTNLRAWIACQGLPALLHTLPPEEQVKKIEEKLAETHGRSIRVRPTFDQAGTKLEGVDLNGEPIEQIVPLRGLGLERLVISRTRVKHLHPLKGMPLRDLNCSETPVNDLDPLRGAPMAALNLAYTRVKDLGPLKGMPLNFLSLEGVPSVEDFGPLAGMPLNSLNAYQAQVKDLTPLCGMPLTSLVLRGTPVRDIGPLRGMRLEKLVLNGTVVADLTPIEDAPLRELFVDYTLVEDLGPLKGKALSNFTCTEARVKDLSPLADMPLLGLDISGCPIQDFSPLGRLERLDREACPWIPFFLGEMGYEELDQRLAGRVDENADYYLGMKLQAEGKLTEAVAAFRQSLGKFSPWMQDWIRPKIEALEGRLETNPNP